MQRTATLWRANIIVFVSSFCVMVIELIAARILAPYIGVSLYTWTSIIGVILGGIALGNFLGGRVADRYPSPSLLSVIFFAGSLLTIAILPTTTAVASRGWFSELPVMLDFTLKTAVIFILPAVVLSMVSPMVIKLTLADLGQTGGVVGTIYACSTAGAILGTFMTGFYLILWFGTRSIVWLVAAILFLIGITVWFSWKITDRWRFSFRNITLWLLTMAVILSFSGLYRLRDRWEGDHTRESNYYAIKVYDSSNNIKILSLDDLVHSYTSTDDPTVLTYDYVKVFAEIVSYFARENQAPRILHLGGGGYTFPRYMEAVYPQSINDVVEIDPVVTEVAHQELGLSPDTGINTYNQDARRFLIQRAAEEKYNFVIGDVFNDKATPYHLTTMEFDELIKEHMDERGMYLVNIIDSFKQGRYMPSFVHTLRNVFDYVYLFHPGYSWDDIPVSSTFVIAATDHPLDLADYERFVTKEGRESITGRPHDEAGLSEYLSERKAILLTDDYAPTDILVAMLFR